MMGVNNVRPCEGARQAERERVGDVSVEMALGGEKTQPKTAWLEDVTGNAAEGNELGIDVGGERARQLERVALAAALQAFPAKDSGSDVGDAHTESCVTDGR